MVSNIDFGECEQLLKKVNGLDPSESLIVYKTDIKSQDLSTTYVQYEVYNPYTLEQLNLSICSDIFINIDIPVILNEKLDSLNHNSNSFGYNIFDENDPLYQDICAKYTTLEGTDMLLSDRTKDIYTESQSQSICQNGCKISSYNQTNKKAKCSCSLSDKSPEITNLNIDNFFSRNEIKNSIKRTISNSNFRVLKCYKLLLDSDIIKNIGEILMTIILFLYLVLIIIYCFTGPKKINYYINFILQNIIIKPKKTLNKKKKGKNKKNKRNILTKNFPPKKMKKKNLKASVLDKLNKFGIKSDSLKSDNKYHSNIFLINNITKIKKINYKKSGKKKYPLRKSFKSDNKKIKLRNSINTKNLKNTDISTIDKKNKGNSNCKMISYVNKRKTVFEIDKTNWKYKLLNTEELNTLLYFEALELDKRTFFQYYCSLLKKKQLILFAFIPTNDYNLVTIKISLFLISFSLYFTINGFFFSDETMHSLYKNNGVYDVSTQFQIILYSTLVTSIINIILRTLSLSEKNILDLKKIPDNKLRLEKSQKLRSSLKSKFIIFYVLSLLFMLFFWYFISCFCAVYINTQIILIKDTFLSFCLSMIYPFGLSFLPGILRISALRATKKDKELLYKISQVIGFI